MRAFIAIANSVTQAHFQENPDVGARLSASPGAVCSPRRLLDSRHYVGYANCARYSFSERPSLRANSSSIEGMEPEGSSSAMRSTRCMGKKTVGNPTRSPSGSFIWRTKWSNEFRSMPRSVTPEVLMASSSPHTFSLGVCKLTITMECGSMFGKASLLDYRVFHFE